MAARLTLALMCLSLAAGAPGDGLAACVFNDFGDITNPNDASCRDVQLRYTRDDDAGNNIALGYGVPRPIESMTAVDGYRSYRALHERHQALDVSSEGVTGVIVGTTVAGRDIWAYRIGDPDNRTADGGPEGAALVNGTIHAREWQSPEAVTELFEQLMEAANDGGFGQYLHENLHVIVLPVLNIDGFLQTQRFPDRATASELQPRDGRMRRKNMAHPSSGGPVDEDIEQTSDNFFGVDLNRNGPNGFGQNTGSSNRTDSLVYRGTSPGTEPEFDALTAAAELGPAQRLRMYADAHSFSQIFFTPITGNARRDRITRSLVRTMQLVLGGKYRYGPSDTFIGLTSEYFAATYLIPAWTLEIEPRSASTFGTDHGHSGFILPESQVARMRDEVAAMLLAGLYTQADKPALLSVRISDAETDQVRFQAHRVAEGGGRRQDVQVNRALVPGRRYRLWLGFNRPMRWRDEAGLPAQYGRLAAAAPPSVRLELPDLAATHDLQVAITESAWRHNPGPDGILRYSDDALVTEFTLPESIPLPHPLPLVIAVDALDITGSRLDAHPATRVDWSDGHWVGYEDQFGLAGDTGGVDCQFVTFVATDPTSGAPVRTPGCRTSAAPSPDPPSNPATSGDSGGGGGDGLWLLFALVPAIVRRLPGW